MLVDTHCHLNSEELYQNVENIINEAINQNVKLFIVPGYTMESSMKAIELAHQYDNVYAAIGFHPTEIKNYGKKEYDWLEEHISDEKVIAVGEIGYDFHWQTTTYEEQKEAFIKQIEIAKKYNKPIIIHCREAIEKTLDTLKATKASAIGGIMHSYSGSYESALEFIKLGFYIGLGGPVTFLNAKAPKEVAQKIDINYLLTETDSPYLSPHPFRGKMNKPSNIPLIFDKIRELRNIDERILEKQILLNVEKLFKIKLTEGNNEENN